MTMSDPMFSSRERVIPFNLLDSDTNGFAVGTNTASEQTKVLTSNSTPPTLAKDHHVSSAALTDATVITENGCEAKIQGQTKVAVSEETLSPATSTPVPTAAVQCSTIVLTDGTTTQPSTGNVLVVPSVNETAGGVLLLPPATSSKTDFFDLHEDLAMTEPLKQAYIFLSECNRQELRKIARRWNCPQGFTKNVLVAKLTMFVYEQVEKNKACGVASILGAVEDWGFEGFLAQWNSVHSEKSFPSLATLLKLSRCNTKTDADATLPELPKPSGKRKWRKTRMREREEALHGTSNKVQGDKHTGKRTRTGGNDAKGGIEDIVGVNLQVSAAIDQAQGTIGFIDTDKVRSVDQNTLQNHATMAASNLDSMSNVGSQKTNHSTELPQQVITSTTSGVLPSDASADANALNIVRNKMEEVSGHMLQCIKVHMGDPKGESAQLARSRNGVAVKAENGVLTSSERPSRIESQMDFETERKLLLELKQAKKEVEAAKGDKELEERWKAFADRIRKKLDAV